MSNESKSTMSLSKPEMVGLYSSFESTISTFLLFYASQLSMMLELKNMNPMVLFLTYVALVFALSFLQKSLIFFVEAELAPPFLLGFIFPTKYSVSPISNLFFFKWSVYLNLESLGTWAFGNCCFRISSSSFCSSATIFL